MESDDPTVKKLNALTHEPYLAKERQERELPREPASKTDKVAPAKNCAITLAAEPRRTYERIDCADPKVEKSKTEILLPNLAYFRNDNELPICLYSTIDNPGFPESRTQSEVTENVDPMR
jgi:hypothetical protein